MPTFTLQVDAGRLAVLTIDQPDSKANVFSRPLLHELAEMLDRIEGHKGLTGLICRSGKPGAMSPRRISCRRRATRLFGLACETGSPPIIAAGEADLDDTIILRGWAKSYNFCYGGGPVQNGTSVFCCIICTKNG